MRLDALAELTRQDAAAGDRQAPLCRRLRHGEVEHVLLDAGEIEPPRDHAGAARACVTKSAIALAGPLIVR